MLATYAQSWYVSAAPILLSGAMLLFSMRRNRAVLRALDGRIQSRADLALVRGAIVLSMRLAIVYMVMMVGFVAALVVCVVPGGMPAPLAGAHVGLFGALTLPLGWWGRETEKKLRGLKVTAPEPDVEATYRLWLTLWNTARLSLPK